MTIAVTKLLSKKRINLERIKRLSLLHLYGRKVFICPRCKKQVPYKSRQCLFCGEKYPFTVKVPLRLLKGVMGGIATQALHDYIHTYIFPKLDVFDRQYLDQYFTILRVQGNARGTTVTNSISVTMDSTPTNGHILIAVIGDGYGAYTVSSISQTGVTWSYQISKKGTYSNIEIWFGVVGANASTSITINMSATCTYGAVADVCEYSGVATTSFLDKTATAVDNGTSTITLSTGTTSNTAGANELWIGAIALYNSTGNQTTPTNAFALLDGAHYQYTAVAYLEKIVSAIATAYSGTTSTVSISYWSGCIATFKAAAPPPAGGVLAQVM